MASLSFQDSNNRRGWRIQFRDRTKRKRVIWLGDVAEHRAKEFFARADHLIAVAKESLPADAATIRWLSALDPALRNKLANVGLCESSEQQQARDIILGEWINIYITERKDVADGTITSFEKARDNLVDYFGVRKKLRTITKADAKRWRIWLAAEGNRRDKDRSTLADATVRRRTGRAKQFFREAVERGYCDSNPFDGLPCTVGSNAFHEWIDLYLLSIALGSITPSRLGEFSRIYLLRNTGMETGKRVWVTVFDKLSDLLYIPVAIVLTAGVVGAKYGLATNVLVLAGIVFLLAYFLISYWFGRKLGRNALLAGWIFTGAGFFMFVSSNG